jgi:GMP synthase (glutamine-hydrolysing)
MRKLLVFQHVPYEPLGTLDAQFRAAGFRIRYVNFSRQRRVDLDVRRYHGLVVLGGPMSVYDSDRYPHLQLEVEAIRLTIDAGVPVLGICLGAQLIAAALGGRVLPNPTKEIGWSEVMPTKAGRKDRLFSCFTDREKIFQWHGDTFHLPAGAELLAESPLCKNQAFCYGEHVYGLQFHLEVDEALIERWLGTPALKRELAELSDGGDASLIMQQTRAFIGRSGELSEAVFGAFIERFYRWRRRHPLPSR